MARAPRLIVISGPSGVGKSTICKGLMMDGRFAWSISATTRRPRSGEKGGVDYHFMSRKEFEDRAAAGEFLEHAEVHGNLYGTLRSAVDEAITAGKSPLLDIDVQGADQIRAAGAEADFVFVLPPSWQVLELRLRGRQSDDPTEIERRLAAARAELARAGEYDFKVENHVLDDAIDKILRWLDRRR